MELFDRKTKKIFKPSVDEILSVIKPIGTIYQMVKFRSRLEARWAVYFDSIGIAWEYEKEGYDLGDDLYYLPDFWLPQVNKWAEVKPTEFTPIEMKKVRRLVYGTGYSCILLPGLPGHRSYRVVTSEYYDGTLIDYDVVLTNDQGYLTNENRFYSCPADDEEFEDVKIAVGRAKSARFEFGEKG
jgi:hypothetical protein